MLAHWGRLDGSARARLHDQLARIVPCLDDLSRAYRAALSGSPAGGPEPALEPVGAIALPQNGGDRKRSEAAQSAGERLLAEGRVAVFLVAGGQGTRLGFPHPKGCFPIGPVTDRSLFEIQAQKIRGLAHRAGRALPWYVMTSEATDTEPRGPSS